MEALRRMPKSTASVLNASGLTGCRTTQAVRSGVLGPDTIGAEFFFGYFVKTGDRYFILAGDQDGRVNELFGLDTVKRFAGTCALTESEARRAATERAAFWMGGQASKTTVIPKLAGHDWSRASSIRRSEGDKGFRAALAYKNERPAVRWDNDALKWIALARPPEKTLLLVLQSWAANDLTVKLTWNTQALGYVPGPQVLNAENGTALPASDRPPHLVLPGPYGDAAHKDTVK